MSDLLPRSFLVVYRDVFGEDPPPEFVEAYETLCHSLYWGSGKPSEPTKLGGRGKRGHGWFFADARLLHSKGIADAHLAATAKALLRWSVPGSRTRRQAAAEAGRTYLARAGDEGRRPQLPVE